MRVVELVAHWTLSYSCDKCLSVVGRVVFQRGLAWQVSQVLLVSRIGLLTVTRVSPFIFLYLSFPRAYPTLTKTHLSCPLSQIRSCNSSRTGPRSSTLFRDRIRSDIRTRLGPASLGVWVSRFSVSLRPSSPFRVRVFFLAPRFPLSFLVSFTIAL